MRTTLTIDDDLAGILRRKSRELGKPFKAIVNHTLRKGLEESLPAIAHAVVVRPHDFGSSPGVDLDRLNQLADELEVEEYLRKAARDDTCCCSINSSTNQRFDRSDKGT
jgi:hypothetical protein